MKRRLAIWGLGLMLAGTAWAWRPSGWVYHDHPWAYDSASGDWMWFNPDTQWVVNMNSGAWATLPGSALATGWVFYQWPYGYAQGNGAWHWINEPDVQWVVNMDTSEWTRFGIPEAPGGMVWIPGGTNAGTDPDAGAYSLTLPDYFMDRYEVTRDLWDEVRLWGQGHGYGDLLAGQGKGGTHPAHTITWYDAVKWCNARTEAANRDPAYYTDAALTQVYRTGRVDAVYVKGLADGFRLPTLEEWTYAARGGATGRRFPWADSDEIQHTRANYYSQSGMSYDTSLTLGYHPTYGTGAEPYTSPAGSFAANAYGLHDMAGNVREWCFEWETGYEGQYRRMVGGNWYSNAAWCRVGYVGMASPEPAYNTMGFRTVLSIP